MTLQVLKPLQLSVMTAVMVIGIVALTAELTSYEEMAKVVVIPSLVLLIALTAYSIIRAIYINQ